MHFQNTLQYYYISHFKKPFLYFLLYYYTVAKLTYVNG